MTGDRWQVGLAARPDVRENYIDDVDLERLGAIADFRFEPFELESSWERPPEASAGDMQRLKEFCEQLDALVVCHGSPRVGESVFAASPRLQLVGELEGDRFGRRIDVAAAQARRIHAVDTTHGSSLPVAEWALGLCLIGVNNAASLFRRLIAGEVLFNNRSEREADPGYEYGELGGKRVGLIGCGHIGRRLIQLLEPFEVELFVHDPYLPSELADVFDATFTSLHGLLSSCDVVVCLVPLTPATRGLLGKEELDLLRPGAVLVNVSRGPVIDSEALIARLRRGDVFGCLDVFDPEPIPADSPIRELPQVFLSPHIAGVSRLGRKRFFSLMVDEIERCHGGHETRYDLTPRTMANRAGTPMAP